MRTLCAFCLCVFFSTISKPTLAAEPPLGESAHWAEDATLRSEHLYPSIWGQVGVFRVRSGYSLPEGTASFGIGGEFYALNGGPDLGAGPTTVNTIAESLFLGYSPLKQLTLSLMRRNSSTTYSANPPTSQLISSLGDFTLGASYEIILSPSLSVQPIANFMVASNFNNLAPSGYTISAGAGLATTWGLYSLTGMPLFVHANLLYHSAQIRSATTNVLQPETFFQFSRFNTTTLGFGVEYPLGSFVPFVEYYASLQLAAPITLLSSPAKVSFGTRFMPLSNKSLSVLVGVDIATARGLAPGIPYTPPAQVIAQLSYTTGLFSNDRKHYFTTPDVSVAKQHFVVKKDIVFKVGSAVLEPSSGEILNEVASVISKNRVRKLLIVGHTDSSHGEDFNVKLSVDRANAVKQYLVKQGIDEETLMTQGYGKRKPRASNATEEGRAQNRRVEFFILDQ